MCGRIRQWIWEDGDSSRCGAEERMEMKVPKRWFMRMSEGPGPKQSIGGESGYLENRCAWYPCRFYSRLLVGIKCAQYPIAGYFIIKSLGFLYLG